MSNESAQQSAGLVSSAVERLLESGTRGVIATVIETVPNGPAVAAKLLVQESGEILGTLGSAELNEAVAGQAPKFLRGRDEAKAIRVGDFSNAGNLTDIKILFERVEAEPRLVIAGAGHVGASLARLAALVGYQVTLIDDRAEFVDRKSFTQEREKGIELVAANDWQRAMREAIGNGRSVSVAIVTRGHKQDEECLRATIQSKPDYIGMIGSKRRTNIVLEKLRQEGFDADELTKVRAPIGLDIRAVSPEEVALSILAEIVAERRGGAGAPLSSWRRS